MVQRYGKSSEIQKENLFFFLFPRRSIFDEDELFNLWEDWERDQFSSCDVAWALERYPDLPDHMDLEDDQDYICFIPDEFNP